MKQRTISIVADILSGLVVIVLFIALDTFLHIAADLRTAIMTLAVLSLGCGYLRWRSPASVWLKGLLVSSGGAAALLVVGWSAILHAVLAILIATLILFTVTGICVRRVLAARSASYAALTLIVPLAVLSVVVFTAIPVLATSIATRKSAVVAPAMSISTLDGAVINSTEFRGHVVILDYWATWCPACRREMPELEKLYRQYRTNSSVVFWAVDVQNNGETPKKARAFMQNAGYTMPVAFDAQNSAGRLQFDGFPSLILMDRSGHIRLVHMGYDRSERLQTELSKEVEILLNEHS